MNFIVFSHLRWNFVFQRPQQLMTRCAYTNRVIYWEEPILDAPVAFLEQRDLTSQLKVVVPHLPPGLIASEARKIQESLLGEFMSEYLIKDVVLWYYTPLALQFRGKLQARAVIYDCMDELSAFRGAPVGLRSAEAELFRTADLVFTGGKSLYESKKTQHPFVHCFPSSIDRDFFGAARQMRSDVEELVGIPRPRLGFCGVIDERMDLSLLAAVAAARSKWQFVMLGPVVKIAESELPRLPNIHYLGPKEYRLLPSYFAGWDVGLLPFARNDSTRFISPTKTPEYLAAGLPAVSTPIADVVDPYGNGGFVHIAETPEEFVTAIESAILSRDSGERLDRVDRFLRHMSWDSTWERMGHLVRDVVCCNGGTELSESAVTGGIEPRNEEPGCSII